MLSRTADHLFWMSRYTERAENMARLLDVNFQSALLPQSAAAAQQGWEGMLRICELLPAYQQQYGDVHPKAVLQFMVRDPNNPSSIVSCLRSARENARAVRGVLTTEVWETQNQTWIELKRMLQSHSIEQEPRDFFEWVKFRSHLSRGVAIGTMLQDEAFHFWRIGTFLERADNTARLLDVKFHAIDRPFPGLADGLDQAAARPGVADAGQNNADANLDFYHWSAILRSVSAFEVYRKVYRDEITPERVAELMILRPDMPRSLLACMNEVLSNLRAVRNAGSGETERLAGKLCSSLQFARIDEIFSGGLHVFLVHFLDRVNQLGTRISQNFLLPASIQQAE